MNIIRAIIEKAPNKLVPDLMQQEQQLALTIYRLAHACSILLLVIYLVHQKH